MLLVVLRIFIQDLRLAMSKKLIVYGLYFLILISIALFVRDIPNQYGSVSVMELTLDKIIKTSEWGDPSSYGLGAIDVATTGWITSDHQVVFNAWPPGFTLLEALDKGIVRSLGFLLSRADVLDLFPCGHFFYWCYPELGYGEVLGCHGVLLY